MAQGICCWWWWFFWWGGVYLFVYFSVCFGVLEFLGCPLSFSGTVTDKTLSGLQFSFSSWQRSFLGHLASRPFRRGPPLQLLPSSCREPVTQLHRGPSTRLVQICSQPPLSSHQSSPANEHTEDLMTGTPTLQLRIKAGSGA